MSEPVLGVVRNSDLPYGDKQAQIRALLQVEVVNQHATLAAAFRLGGAAQWSEADLTEFLLVISQPGAGLSKRQFKSLERLWETAVRDLPTWTQVTQPVPFSICFREALRKARAVAQAESTHVSAARPSTGSQPPGTPRD